MKNYIPDPAKSQSVSALTPPIISCYNLDIKHLKWRYLMNRYFTCLGLPGSFVLTILLSLTALLSAIIQPSIGRWLCFAAMILSSIGDIFLMRFMGLNRIFPNYFLWGAASFMIAHIIYTLSYRSLAASKSLSFFNGGVVLAAIIALCGLIYVLYTCHQRNNYSNFILVTVYLFIICINCASIFSYAWASFPKHPWTIFAAIGALSFFISDFIIGIGMLAGVNRYDHLIWWFYPIGQILIILFCR